MSLIPHIVRALVEEFSNNPIHEQELGSIERIPRSMGIVPSVSMYERPWRLGRPEDSGVSSICNNDAGFKVTLDVQHFKPEELNVKVVGEFLVVDGQHEERTDEHGFVSRKFTRRYRIPDSVNMDAIQSTLSSDSILQVVAPKKVAESKSERNIPISKINPLASPFTSPKPPAEKRMKIEVGT